MIYHSSNIKSRAGNQNGGQKLFFFGQKLFNFSSNKIQESSDILIFISSDF